MLLVSDPARAIFRIVDNGTDGALFWIGAAVEVRARAPVQIHAYAQLFGKFAHVDANSERPSHVLGLAGRVVHPATPPAVHINEH
jgi:hypothetical protein